MELGENEERTHKSNFTKTIDNLWDAYIWPVSTLVTSLRPLHYWAIKHIADIKKGQKVLEIGSGYPQYKIYSEMVGKEGLYVALDLNQIIQKRSRKICLWLNKFKQKAKTVEEQHVTASGERLPFTHNEFDTLLASNFTGPDDYISEAYRSLNLEDD